MEQSHSSVYKWSFIDRISLALINFGVNIVLARMLTTADYGLLSMIAIFIAIAADLSSCGLSDGLVHKTRPTERDYSTVFVFNSTIGFLFGVAFFFGGPLAARYFGHEEIVTIMRVLGVCFFFQTMSYVQETRLRKQLKMKQICIVRISATVTVSVMAIAAAYMGYGYKALICTQILVYFFFFLYYTLVSRWFPRIDFSLKSFKEMFFYGVHLMLAYLATVVGKNVNTFILGRYYPSSSASGIYYQGAKLAAVPFGVTESSLNSPFFVVASNEENPDKQRGLILSMFPKIIGINGTIMLFIFIIASPCIEMLYGIKWIGAIPIFRILAVAEFLFCTKSFFQIICKVYARTVFVRNMGFIEVACQLTLLLIFYRYGILWIAWTQVGGVAISVFVYATYCRRFTHIGLWGYLPMVAKALWLPAVASIVSLAVLWAVSGPVVVTFCSVLLSFGISFIAVGELTNATIYLAAKHMIFKK